VETPFRNYTPEFEHSAARGEIWRYQPLIGEWTRVYQSPLVRDAEGVEFSRDLGYRAMMVYQGKSDRKPALYVATWSRSRGDGPDFLRTEDGEHFDVLPKARFHTGNQEIKFNAIRALTVFKGKLYTAPTGATGGNVNASGVTYVYATDDPVSGDWRCVNEPGFGTLPDVATVYDIQPMGDHLYAGTGGLAGFQIWRTTGEGDRLPYRWERVMEGGAGRGALNQGAVAMQAFRGSLYIGTGIQNGGFDWKNKIGPAAAEIVRLNEDLSWDIVVGNARDGKEPLSGLGAGFNNFFSGYLWRMGVHDGWLYAGTMDWGTHPRRSRHRQICRTCRGVRIVADPRRRELAARHPDRIWQSLQLRLPQHRQHAARSLHRHGQSLRPPGGPAGRTRVGMDLRGQSARRT
jgi:hypothetical protein